MIASLFPGQGSQFAGFLRTLGGTTPHARIAETIEEASDVLHMDVLSLDCADALDSTVAVQISLLVAGIATVRALRDEGVVPDAVAGLSVWSKIKSSRASPVTPVMVGGENVIRPPPGTTSPCHPLHTMV